MEKWVYALEGDFYLFLLGVKPSLKWCTNVSCEQKQKYLEKGPALKAVFLSMFPMSVCLTDTQWKRSHEVSPFPWVTPRWFFFSLFLGSSPFGWMHKPLISYPALLALPVPGIWLTRQSGAELNSPLSPLPALSYGFLRAEGFDTGVLNEQMNSHMTP